MEDTTIRTISAGDMDAVCQVIGEAFADNPNALAIAKGDHVKAQRMMSGSARVAKFARSCSYALIAQRENQVIGALNAASWPACQLSTGEKAKSAPAMVRVTGMGLPRAMKLTGAWAKHDPKEPHWHIGPIGVAPQFQGQGVGKALLAAFLEKADSDGTFAYLETDVDRNVLLYQQFGFQVIGEQDILGVNNRFMRREVSPLAT